MRGHILTRRPASRVRGHAVHLNVNASESFTHADAPKYIMPPIVHAWWQMFLRSLFTDTTSPAVCSLQLQDGLTALSNTVIITLHALEESEDAAFLDGNHVQLQLNEWRSDIYYRTNQAYPSWSFEGMRHHLSMAQRCKNQPASQIKCCR